MKLKFGRHVAVVILLSVSALFGQQQGWFERIFPPKSPQVVSDTPPTRPLVTPAPDVLNLQNSFAKVADAVKPAVVNISAVSITRVEEQPNQFFYGDPNDFFHRYFYGEPQRRSAPREFRTEGTGSGVIIDPDGYILTNNHVVQGATQLTVTLSDGKSLKGSVVGTDPRTDLAVIRVKGPNPFAFAPLADSSKTKIGDWVLAVGSPFGLEQTVTAGIISAIRQSLNIEGRVFRNLLQTDAAINRGNSGGPLVNIYGEVVGINTAIFAPTGVFSGIGFAIPANDAKLILKDLIEKGFVERSWMGVEILDVDEVIAQQFGLSSTEGALINRVVEDSPAAKAGLERGDIIVEFDGTPVTKVQQLQDAVSATKPGRKVKVIVVRNGKRKTLDLLTAIMPGPKTAAEVSEDRQEDPKPETTEWLGATWGNVGRQAGGTGVVVLKVPPESQAAEAGLQEGDVVKAINRSPLGSISDLNKVQKTVDAKKGFVFDVERDGRSFYLSFKALR